MRFGGMVMVNFTCGVHRAR